jgi:hypothetical protein
MAGGLGLGSRLIRLLSLRPDSHCVDSDFESFFDGFDDDVSAQFGSGNSDAR